MISPVNNQSFGRESEVLDTKFSLSGQLIEIRKVKEQLFDPQVNRFKSREYTVVHPPLMDGMTAASVNDIRECRCCNGLFHVTNGCQCPRCRYHCYVPHQEQVLVDGLPVDLCLVCAAEVKELKIVKAFKAVVWGL